MFTEDMMNEEMMNFVELDDAEMEEISGGKKKVNYKIGGVTGKSHVRTGPGMNFKIIGVLHTGEETKYLGKSAYDENGRKWYKIEWNGRNAWVSSRYTGKAKY